MHRYSVTYCTVITKCVFAHTTSSARCFLTSTFSCSDHQMRLPVMWDFFWCSGCLFWHQQTRIGFCGNQTSVSHPGHSLSPQSLSHRCSGKWNETTKVFSANKYHMCFTNVFPNNVINSVQCSTQTNLAQVHTSGRHTCTSNSNLVIQSQID